MVPFIVDAIVLSWWCLVGGMAKKAGTKGKQGTGFNNQNSGKTGGGMNLSRLSPGSNKYAERALKRRKAEAAKLATSKSVAALSRCNTDTLLPAIAATEL